MKTNNLSKNTLLLAVGTFINKGLLFVMIPLFSSWLSTEDYGRFDVFCTYVALMIPIVTLACNEAVFRFGIEKETISEKGIYITNGLVVVLMNSIIMVVVVGVVSFWTKWEYTFPFLLMSFGEILNSYLQGYMRAIRKLNIYSFCTAFLTICISIFVTIFVLFFDMGLKGIIFGYAFGYIMGDFAIIGVTKFIKYIDLKKISKSTIKEMLLYSYMLIPNNISWWVISVSDRMIVNLFLGDTINGIYAVASKIPNFCTAIFGVFSISWQETATDMLKDENRDAYYNSILNRMIRLLLTLCGVIVCCNFIFFDMIFEMRYSQARFYTPILISSAIFSSLSQYFGGIQISLKRPKANGISTVIGAVINLFIHIALIKYIGLYAATISTLISNVVIMLVRMMLIRDVISFRINRSIIIYVIVYIYFLVASYMNGVNIFNVANLLLALVLFAYANKEVLKKIILKVIRKV